MQVRTLMPPLALIVAYTREGRVIGKNGKLPWRYPEDLRWFREKTSGHAIIMGRVTYESIGRPLPDRRSIVVSSSPDFRPEGVQVCRSLPEAIEAARQTDPLPFVIGGVRLFTEALPLATHLFLTEIDTPHEGDRFLPPIDEQGWVEVERRPLPPLLFRVLVRTDR